MREIARRLRPADILEVVRHTLLCRGRKRPERVNLLYEAAELTMGDRNRDYGEPVTNMQKIADIFNAISGRDLSAREIAQVHVATKLARTSTSPVHRDSYVDAMAYRGIEFECAVHEAKRSADNL